VDTDLKVRAYEIVGVAGVSGNGQQALSALLSGSAPPAAGSVRLLGRPWPGPAPSAIVAAGVGRIPEDRHAHGVVGDLTIAENLALESYREPGLQRLGVVRRGALRAHAERLIETYDVRCEGPGQRVRLLSGGNIQKLVLARVLEREPAFILADQPTRGLDVGAVAYVHGRLLDARRRGAAILLISEDLDELLDLSEPLPTRALTVRELGLMMAGQGRHAAA
jgi:simple sugar transport system ATP-binding protein